MPVDFKNFEFSYLGPSGKRIFVPSERGRKLGCELKALVEAEVTFEPIFYHLAKGGHVAAIHAHRKNSYFAKIDLRNFFYGIGRNRVARALYDRAIVKSGFWAKWSCVKNPYAPPSYSLPYGFVQSPILATLVLRDSALGNAVLALSDEITVSVYLDDIALSASDQKSLSTAFDKVLVAAKEAKLEVNSKKVVGPTDALVLFNCELRYAHSAVVAERREKFYAEPRSAASAAAFEEYCESVEGKQS